MHFHRFLDIIGIVKFISETTNVGSNQEFRKKDIKLMDITNNKVGIRILNVSLNMIQNY